jgi:transposase InsO family protein
VGTLKGVGRVYAQTFVDAHCSWAQAKPYLSKIPMTPVDLLHERVLPVYEQAGIALERVLTDNGREYCGRPLAHPYDLYLAVQQVEHRNTKVHSPRTNGFCERFHRTLKAEFFSVQLRKKFYGSLGELQEDLHTWVRRYNEERSHQGYRILLPLSLSPPIRHASRRVKEVDLNGRGTPGEHPTLDREATSGPGSEHPEG